MDTLLHIGLGNALAATVLAVVALLGTRLTRRPAVAHALWLLVLLKLLTPPLWTVPILPPTAAVPPQPVNIALPPASLPREAGIASVNDSPTPLPSLWTWQQVVPVVWLAGALLWWALATRRLHRFAGLLRLARPAAQDIVEVVRRLAQRMGLRRCPSVWLVPAPVSPLLLALGRTARVLLPEALWPRLSAAQREAILAHELAHLRRGDHWVRRLEMVVLGLYWWFPLAWYARRRLQEAEEECCDAQVVRALPESAADYAAALVETVAFLSAGPLPLPASASGAGQVPLLKRRLTMILRETPNGRLGPLGMLAVAGAVALLPLLPTWAQVPDRPLAPKLLAGKEPALAEFSQPQPDGKAVHGKALLDKLQQACMNCHADAHQLPGRLTDKSDWKAMHDGLAALYDSVRKQQPDPERAAREERVQEARDEIELMEARLRVKESHLLAARSAAERAQKRLKKAVESSRAGMMPEAELDKIRDEAGTLQSQAQIQEAEMQVERLSLEQAQRRLSRLMASRRTDLRPEPDLQEQRMRQLQLRAEKLMHELDAIRKEIRKTQQSPEPPGR